MISSEKLMAWNLGLQFRLQTTSQSAVAHLVAFNPMSRPAIQVELFNTVFAHADGDSSECTAFY